jgi:hypothetical protein
MERYRKNMLLIANMLCRNKSGLFREKNVGFIGAANR